MDDLLPLARSLATQAADLLVESMARTAAGVGTKSSPTDMVTDVDRASERLIVEGITRARPHDAVVGEEGSSVAGTSGVRWIVDPLDGTTNYLYGHPGFAVSIAAEVDGEIEVAVVADPLHHDLFTAIRGRGARRNDAPVRANRLDDLTRALVATGFSYDRARRARQAGVLSRVLPAVRDIRRGGAASVDLCWAGCGRVDAFYERGLAPWDFAAGALVAREGGCLTDDGRGGPPSPDLVVAAPPGLAEPLRRLLTEADVWSA